LTANSGKNKRKRFLVKNDEGFSVSIHAKVD
jgi:hypothetical protein